MPDAHHFLINLALVLCVAAVTTVLFRLLRQPAVLGYLLAGAVLSPHTPFPLFADESTVHALSELGVILLMFSLGLEFSIPKLLRVAPTAGVVGVIQCSLMMWLGYVTGRAFGWTVLESVYTGALIAISSTTIIVKAFAEQNIRGRLTDIVFGVLIIEDLIAIFLLAVLTTISSGENLTAGTLAVTAGKLLAFLAAVVGGGLLVVPRLMRAIVRLDVAETTVVSSVGLCFALALLADAFGYSVALGAFIAGALVAESGEATVVEQLVQPVRDIFAAVFFVAVGMLINPSLIADHLGATVVLTLVVVTGTLVGVSVGAFLAGQDVRTSIQAGMSLAQIGEFSFIIAAVGAQTGATRPFLYPVAVAVSAATTLLTPWLIRASGPVATWVDRHLPSSIHTFAALYGSWVEQLRSPPGAVREVSGRRRLILLILLDASLLVALTIATAVWNVTLAKVIAEKTLLSPDVAWVAVLAAAAALALPFGVGIVRLTAALARMLAETAFPAATDRADFAAAPRRALVLTLELALLLAIGVPIIAITQPFLPAGPGAAVMALAILLLGFALLRSAADLEQHARAGAQAIVEMLANQLHSEEGQSPEAGERGELRDELAELHRMLPGLGAPVPIRIRPGTTGVGKTLAEINLRSLTGATVLAIVRERVGVLTPTGRETLRAGDLLAIAGTAEAVESAERLLAA